MARSTDLSSPGPASSLPGPAPSLPGLASSLPGPALSSPGPAPRLWLEPAGSPPAVTQGCWWPRSTDPVAELPGLVRALDELGAPVVRVRVSAAGWSRRPHEVEVAGRSVTVGYFSGQSTGLLTAIRAGGAGLAVRVVPPVGARAADHGEPELRAAAS